MLRQFCRRSRLAVAVGMGQLKGISNDIARILCAPFLRLASPVSDVAPMNRVEQGEYNRHGKALDSGTYELLFAFHRTQFVDRLRHRYDETRPEVEPLPSYAHWPRELTLHKRVFTRLQDHIGSSGIAFHDAGRLRCGRIRTICAQAIGGAVRTVLFIDVFAELTAEDRRFDPFAVYAYINTRLVYAMAGDPEVRIILPDDVVSHVACLTYPAGTFGCQRETMAVHCLDRGRRMHLYTWR